jgi:hypothetical protein
MLGDQELLLKRATELLCKVEIHMIGASIVAHSAKVDSSRWSEKLADHDGARVP